MKKAIQNKWHAWTPGAPECLQRCFTSWDGASSRKNAWSTVRTFVVFFQVPFTESSDVKESGQRQVEKHIAEMGLPWTSFRRVTGGKLMVLALEGLLSSRWSFQVLESKSDRCIPRVCLCTDGAVDCAS